MPWALVVSRLRHRRTLCLRDRFQVAPERIFERDAGPVAIDSDGAFDDLRFHRAPFALKAFLGSYRDSVPAKRRARRRGLKPEPGPNNRVSRWNQGGRGPENNVS